VSVVPTPSTSTAASTPVIATVITAVSTPVVVGISRPRSVVELLLVAVLEAWVLHGWWWQEWWWGHLWRETPSSPMATWTDGDGRGESSRVASGRHGSAWQ